MWFSLNKFCFRQKNCNHFFSFFLIRQLKSTDMLYRLEKQHIKFIFSPCPSYRWHWPFNQVASLNCLPFLYPLLIRLPVFLPRFSGPALLRFHCLTFSFFQIFQIALWGWLIDDNFLDKRERMTGIWSLDPWSGKLLRWPLDRATPPNRS